MTNERQRRQYPRENDAFFVHVTLSCSDHKLIHAMTIDPGIFLSAGHVPARAPNPVQTSLDHTA